MLSEKQKNIYNTHLATSRKLKNKPFKIRQNFDKLDQTTISILVKLEYLFDKYPDINIKTYFEAPYKVWPDKEYFPLEYFATHQATKAYTLYKKQLLTDDIDSKEVTDKIIDSLTFIAKFCIQNKMTLEEYYTHKTGVTYTWMKHVRRGNILPYVIFGFKNIDNIFYDSPEDERDLLLGKFGNDFYIYKGKYNKSSNTKNMVVEGLKRIEKWIIKNINT